MKLNFEPFLCASTLLLLVACSSSNIDDTTFFQKNKKSADNWRITLYRGTNLQEHFVLTTGKIVYRPHFVDFPIGCKDADSLHFHRSETVLDTVTARRFFYEIQEKGLLKLPTYSENPKYCCNSSTIVIFQRGKFQKIFISEDFEKNCPQLLQYIEKQMIAFHGKGLGRKYVNNY